MLIANAQSIKTKYKSHHKRCWKREDYGTNGDAQAAFSPNRCSTWPLHRPSEWENGCGAMPATPAEPLK